MTRLRHYPEQVVEGYAYLTGTDRCRRWSLGFEQSATITPGMLLREVADRFRKDKIPGDVLDLDLDYQDRNRPFTVDPQTFPIFLDWSPISRKQHFQFVPITRSSTLPVC